MKAINKTLVFMAVTLLSFIPVIAMAAGPGFSGGVDDGGGGACAPIDGGISMLVVAGVSYGAKLVVNARKNKSTAVTEQQ